MRASTVINNWMKRQSLIHLQGYGEAKAKPAKEFKVGEKMLWNYGGKTMTKAILKETKCFITFQIEEDGELYERRLKKNRLVAIG